jgi:hypothetical protein
VSKKDNANSARMIFRHSVDVDDLVESAIESLTFDEIHDLIVKLDKACEDWGVTENLHKYFSCEMKKCPKDDATEAA